MAKHTNKPNKWISRVTKALNKRGDKIKGANKAETKLLKCTCTHHRYSKSRKLIKTIDKYNGRRQCYLCGADFRAKFYPNKREDGKEKFDSNTASIADIKKMMNEFLAQLRFMAVATNSGNETIDYVCDISARLAPLYKTYKKVRNVAQKSASFKSKRKKQQEITQSYGDFRRKRR